MTTDFAHLNLGALRCAMSLTVHTYHAARIWNGRRRSDNKPGIIGLNGFVGIMNKLKRGGNLFTLAQRHQYSGARRDDFASGNAVARAAREKFGELPQDVLEGTRRSRFAPLVGRRPAPGRQTSREDDDASLQTATPIAPAAGEIDGQDDATDQDQIVNDPTVAVGGNDHE